MEWVCGYDVVGFLVIDVGFISYGKCFGYVICYGLGKEVVDQFDGVVCVQFVEMENVFVEIFQYWFDFGISFGVVGIYQIEFVFQGMGWGLFDGVVQVNIVSSSDFFVDFFGGGRQGCVEVDYDCVFLEVCDYVVWVVYLVFY